jgi:hypothetical protein
MYLASSRPVTRLRWVFVYAVWIFAEVLSLSPFGYSIFAIVMWILGDISGPAFFLGIIPGFTLFETIKCLIRRSKLPWHAGDYFSYGPMELQVHQVRSFHTVVWCKEKAIAMPHRTIKLYRTKPVDTLNGFTVYQDPMVSFSHFYGWTRFLAYVWAIFCEVVVFAIFLLSAWFVFWAGVKAAVSFAIGMFLPFSILNMHSRTKIKGGGEFADEVVLAGTTWLVMDIYGTFRLRFFMLYELILEINSECR